MTAQLRRCPYCGAIILNDITGNYHVLRCKRRVLDGAAISQLFSIIYNKKR